MLRQIGCSSWASDKTASAASSPEDCGGLVLHWKSGQDRSRSFMMGLDNGHAIPNAGSFHRAPRPQSGAKKLGHLVKYLGVIGQGLEAVREPLWDVEHSSSVFA